MKAALTIWEKRISPVFDSAQMLLVAEIKNKEVINKQHEKFNPEMPSRLTNMLIGLNVDVLICGAISEIPANAIEACGIKLIPFIAGNVNEVLDTYAKGLQLEPAYLMPGCGKNCQRQEKGHNRRNKRRKEVIMPKKDGTGPQGKGQGTGKGMGKCNTSKGGKRSGQANAGRKGTGSSKGGGQGRGAQK